MKLIKLYNCAKKVGDDHKVPVIIAFLTTLFLILLILPFFNNYSSNLLSGLGSSKNDSAIIKVKKNAHEVFGFAPYWTLNKLDNVDFSVLTTLAYFGLPIKGDGNIDKSDRGYIAFHSEKASSLFARAHKNGTRVVAALTQMDNDEIKSLMDDGIAQETAIVQIIAEVKNRGIDGINVDFEYVGNPGDAYKAKFSKFVKTLSERMHKELPGSQVTVSVYASSVRYPKIYDVGALADSTDGIFMMAYDFATVGSDKVIPTAPLYGYKEGKYWYDISTAVDDFLSVMPSNKLILGLPWYGYDYPVAQPEIKADKDNGYYSWYWYRGRKYKKFIARPKAHASTYAIARDGNERSGWDEMGQVGWRAYQDNDGWRMIFLDDVRSLGIKYDFAKDKRLGGVGMWALGFDHGNNEMWELLANKFGKKQVDTRIAAQTTYDN